MTTQKKSAKDPLEFQHVLMQGNQAIAEGAIAAGCKFFGGYPITPATEIAEFMAKKLPSIGGTFVQMEDEIASMGAIIGASLAGAKSMTATSGPGFSLMQELIGYSCITEIPCVVVNVMRGGPSTGLATSPAQGDVMQARWGTHGVHPSIVLAVSNVEECFHLTITAFNLSEKYRMPVILLSDEIVSHTREKFIIPDPKTLNVVSRIKPKVPPEWYVPYQDSTKGVPPMANFGEGYRYHVTGLVHDIYGFPTEKAQEIESFYERLHRKVSRSYREIEIVKEHMMEDADIVIIAYGSVVRSAINAAKRLRKQNIKVGILQLITLFPFPSFHVVNALKQAKRLVLVPEMNFGQISREVTGLNQKFTKVNKLNICNGGPITPDDIAKAIRVAL